ncbi:MAG: ribonuclease HI [Chloroflexi bacterium]|nr:ribonuclease HI [Chloroflexota bacterium]
MLSLMDTPLVTIYTDGACDPNPGPGGWAAILRAGKHTRELTGAAPETTNNRMELTAAVEALRALKQPCRVALHTDSEYLQKGVTAWLPRWQARGWRRSGKKPVANQDLWQALLAETERHEIEWRWVRGHAGNPLNERADRLATDMIPLPALPPDDPGTASLYVGVSCPGTAGGWGVVLRAGEAGQELSGRESRTTANRLLILAAAEGLRRSPAGMPVRLYTSAEYLYRAATEWLAGWQRNGWRTREGQPVKNQDAWRALVEAAAAREVQWQIVKGETPPALVRAAALAAEMVQ